MKGEPSFMTLGGQLNYIYIRHTLDSVDFWTKLGTIKMKGQISSHLTLRWRYNPLRSIPRKKTHRKMAVFIFFPHLGQQ